MLNRSKSVWTIALTLASVALIVSAGAQAQGKSAGKGKGAEKAQAAWDAPGHVKAKGNGHPNHKGNGYGHGPHEGHDDEDNSLLLPGNLPAAENGCFWAAAADELALNPFSNDSRSIGYFGYYITTAPGFAYDSLAPLTLLTEGGNSVGSFELEDAGSKILTKPSPADSTISFNQVYIFAGGGAETFSPANSSFQFVSETGSSTTFPFDSANSKDDNGLVEFVVYAQACGANPDDSGTGPS